MAPGRSLPGPLSVPIPPAPASHFQRDLELCGSPQGRGSVVSTSALRGQWVPSLLCPVRVGRWHGGESWPPG